MEIKIDTAAKTVVLGSGADAKEVDLFSKEAFDVIARLWTDVGWVRKFSYMYSWMGRPIIQLPEDMVRVQEAIYEVKPDVIVETGIAHGGSLIYYASLCKAMGKGRVIGVDIEIRPHNRAAIEAHEMVDRITMIEGSSVDAGVVEQVRGLIKPGETVMVILDSNHTKAHVAAELAAYAEMATVGSYVLVADGIMENVAGFPRTEDDWATDNPATAAREFVAANPKFEIVDAPRPFDESMDAPDMTYHPSGWLRRVS